MPANLNPDWGWIWVEGDGDNSMQLISGADEARSRQCHAYVESDTEYVYVGHSTCAERCSAETPDHILNIGASACRFDRLTNECSGFCGCGDYLCYHCNCESAPVCREGGITAEPTVSVGELYSLVGNGECMSSSCSATFGECPVNGYYKEFMETDEATALGMCRDWCESDENCIGFSHTHDPTNGEDDLFVVVTYEDAAFNPKVAGCKRPFSGSARNCVRSLGWQYSRPYPANARCDIQAKDNVNMNWEMYEMQGTSDRLEKGRRFRTVESAPKSMEAGETIQWYTYNLDTENEDRGWQVCFTPAPNNMCIIHTEGGEVPSGWTAASSDDVDISQSYRSEREEEMDIQKTCWAKGTYTPTMNPTPTPTFAVGAPQRREVHFLNSFAEMLGSEEENLDEFLASCTSSIREMFHESTISCIHAWADGFGQMIVRIQDNCGNDCDSLDHIASFLDERGMDVAGFGYLHTEDSGTPTPTFAPTVTIINTEEPTESGVNTGEPTDSGVNTEEPTDSSVNVVTDAPTASSAIPCADQVVDIEMAVWMGVDWSIVMEALTIVEEGQPQPPACHASAYMGPDDGEAPIHFQETCCLPGGQYILQCRATFDWGDSSVSVNGQEYCRGLNEEAQSHVIHLDGPAYNPAGPEETPTVPSDVEVDDIDDDIVKDADRIDEESSAPAFFSVLSILFVVLASM